MLMRLECKYLSLNIGTHDVQTCIANNCSKPGTVNITCNFTENSNAMGYLPILSSNTNPSDEMFFVASRHDITSSELNISIPGVFPDDYTVIVFDLGRNGLPPMLSGNINYAAAEDENITVTNPGEAKSKVYICAWEHLKYRNVPQIRPPLLQP